jgi:hypothetical protein
VNRSSNPAAQTTLLLRLGGDDPRSADLGGVSADLGGVSADLGGVSADLGGVSADLGREPSGAEGAAEGAAVACGCVSHGTGSHSPR